jgi:hypothetical protein
MCWRLFSFVVCTSPTAYGSTTGPEDGGTAKKPSRINFLWTFHSRNTRRCAESRQSRLIDLSKSTRKSTTLFILMHHLYRQVITQTCSFEKPYGSRYTGHIELPDLDATSGTVTRDKDDSNEPDSFAFLSAAGPRELSTGYRTYRKWNSYRNSPVNIIPSATLQRWNSSRVLGASP